MTNPVVAREATEDDVGAIRDIFMASYGEEYPYQHFYDERWLKRSVYNDELLMLVAVDSATNEVLGTGSVVLDIGAYSDLIGEFGRLVVHPEARGRGVGKVIMQKRIEMIRSRLHGGIVDNRTDHPYSQRISRSFGFGAIGFLPLKHRFFGTRESIAMYMRHFGSALVLRRNHPRIVPEAAVLADLAMENMGLKPDAIIDDSSAPYPHDDDFELDTLESETLPSLLRIERGRLQDREVFGPMRLTYGFFKLQARQASYLIARRPHSPREGIAGAIGYLHDAFERNIRVFELIATTDASVRHLFRGLVDEARERGVEYIEVEVSAHAPRMQRTLLELGFLPAAFVPSMVFHAVERLDVVKMVRLLVPPALGELHLTEEMSPIYDAVMRGFEEQAVLPSLEAAMHGLSLFSGLSEEQARRLAGTMRVCNVDEGEEIFAPGERADDLYVVMDGCVDVSLSEFDPLGRVTPGEVLGERAMLSENAHSARAVASAHTSLAVLDREQLQRLVRQRPDIAVVLYRNLAVSLGKKLSQADVDIATTLRQLSEIEQTT